MAAAGFTPIQLYFSTTASATPTSGNLANGELAINITDGKLFYKDNGGTVQVLATKGAGTIGGSNTQVQYNSSGALAGSANLTFDGTTLSANALTVANAVTLSGGTANGVAYLNGSKVLTTGSALTFDGTTLANTAGNLLLASGVTPSAWNSGVRMIEFTGAAIGSNNTPAQLYLLSNAYLDSGGWKYKASNYAVKQELTNGTFTWYTAPSGTAGNAISFTQAMTLDASGALIIGATTRAQTAKLTLQATAGSSKFGVGPLETSSTNFFVVNASGTGVYLTDGATSWTANSDERLKDIIEPISDAANKVGTLRAVIGKYKTDTEGTRRSFLIAQDVKAVLPEAVNVQNDEIGTLGVRYTDTIPLLVAAIQEQQAIIESLKARLEAANL